MTSKIVLIIGILSIQSLAFSQKLEPNKVPAEVRKAFTTDYPQAMAPSWRMADKNYQVIFSLDNVKHAAKYDKSGRWVDKEERIKTTDLPEAIIDAISKNFPGFKAYEAEKAMTASKGLLYNVGLEKEKDYMEVHFSEKGDIIEKIPKTSKSEWGKDVD